MSEQSTIVSDDAFVADILSRYPETKGFMEAQSVHVKHFVPTLTTPDGVYDTRYGGLTVAFQRFDRYVKVATSVCSDDDVFNGKVGAVLAVERLMSGQFILVPLAGLEPLDVVKGMFTGLLDLENGFDDEFYGDEELGGFGLPEGLVVIALHEAEREADEASIRGIREDFGLGNLSSFNPFDLKQYPLPGIAALNLDQLLKRDGNGIPPALQGLASTLASRLGLQRAAGG